MLAEEVTFEYRPEGDGEGSREEVWGESIAAKDIAHAKVLRLERGWQIWGARRVVWLEESEREETDPHRCGDGALGP